jgi:hypothetical protein
MDTIVDNLARGDPHFKKLIHARVGAPRIPPEFEGTEIIYEDLPRHGGKHAHRRKFMSKCKSKKTRRTRNTRKRLRNYH